MSAICFKSMIYILSFVSILVSFQVILLWLVATGLEIQSITKLLIIDFVSIANAHVFFFQNIWENPEIVLVDTLQLDVY